jgi:DNA-binding NarL/FixJ family response regulator
VTRVAVIAESARVRRELSDIVRGASALELVASSASLDELDAVHMDDVAGIDVLLVEGAPVTPAAEELGSAFVALCDDAEPRAALRQHRAGAALLSTRATPEQIVAAIGAVAQGLFVLHMDVRGPLRAPADHSLTPREREVLQMLAAGLGNKAIGLRLGISEHTAKFHVAQILAKLDAASRAEAVSIAMRRGLVPL